MRTMQNKDLFHIANGPTQAICVTTNGMIKKNGHAVMGAGVAKTANAMYQINQQPLSLILAQKLKSGNHVYDLGICQYGYHIFSFPTKHDWRDNSDLNLIRQSCMELMQLCDQLNIQTVFLPKPGCANGHLNWRTQVFPVCSLCLDNRCIVLV